MSDVRVVFSKWGDQPHWEYAAHRLGEDEHGTWLGVPQGTVISRPGASFATQEAQVVLLPSAGHYVATFYAPGGGARCWLYVDITSSASWEGQTVRVVDLDLDVVKGWTGDVWVEDEDEFADHRVRFGYPAEVVALAVTSCHQVLGAVEAGAVPFDGAPSERWLDRLEEVMMAP